jgi:BirA family transcriptional regulator, biotin operon repressor / biotin---[acetyl-CoA-carboxylase] ligase
MNDSPLPAWVFARLADGEFHSGQNLARDLGVTRSAIWKAVAALRGLGVEMQAVRNRGYRLAAPSEPLDAIRLRDALSPTTRDAVTSLEIVWSCASTNDALLGRGAPLPGTTAVMLAEYQSAGRGRRGRKWLAPPGAAICMSLAWTFAELPRDLSALSLVVGVCVLRALARLGGRNLELKWPNDVLCERRKLCGTLIELRAESAGPTTVVIGIGINCAIGSSVREAISSAGLTPADLRDAGIGSAQRNAIAASVLEACVKGLQTFEREGAAGFLKEWQRVDALRDHEVTVQLADGARRGIARGVDLTGALLVENPQGVTRFISGDVSVRFDA